MEASHEEIDLIALIITNLFITTNFISLAERAEAQTNKRNGDKWGELRWEGVGG